MCGRKSKDWRQRVFIGLFLNKCITLVLTLLEAQHDTDFVTGDEVDGGTVLTSKSLCA